MKTPAPATAPVAPPVSSTGVIVHGAGAALPAGLLQIKPTGQMLVRARQGDLLKLPKAASKVLVADPAIASYQVPSPTSLFVFGERIGATTLYVLDERDAVIAAVKVVVEHDLDSLAAQLKRSLPQARIELEPALNGKVVVRGQVRSPQEAKQVSDQVQAFLDSSAPPGTPPGGGGRAGENGGVVNQLRVEQSSQVNIQVRVVEVSRSLTHELGFNWSSALTTSGSRLAFGSGNAAGLFDAAANNTLPALLPASSTGGAALGGLTTRGRFSVGGLISALSSQGMATVLAEPNLTAMSGESAAFAAGGEVPIVIITNNNVTIEYKSYGVILRMTPTLLSADRISLHIAPEVSELTAEGSVTLDGGSTIPAFTVRRADTTVELASGQSFALAGMLRANNSQQVSGVPGLSSIPLLGRLFEHEATEVKETELVILVTANVVDPVAAGNLQVPGQGLAPIDATIPRQATAGYLY
ncbi:MAG: type II and III secretion system protein family protein [Duganella sp.]